MLFYCHVPGFIHHNSACGSDSVHVTASLSVRFQCLLVLTEQPPCAGCCVGHSSEGADTLATTVRSRKLSAFPMASVSLLHSAQGPGEFWVIADTPSQRVLSLTLVKLCLGTRACPGVWELMLLQRRGSPSAGDFARGLGAVGSTVRAGFPQGGWLIADEQQRPLPFSSGHCARGWLLTGKYSDPFTQAARTEGEIVGLHPFHHTVGNSAL